MAELPSGKEFARLPARWRLIDQPLSFQFLAAGGIVFLFSLVSLTLLLVQVGHQSAASRWLTQTHQTIGKLNDLGRDFFRQQTAVREYLRAGDPRYLANVKEGRKFWADGYQGLHSLVADDPRQSELLAQLNESYRSWSSITDALMEERVRANPARLREEGAAFKEAFLLIDRLIDGENSQLSIRNAREKIEIQSTFKAIALINVVLILAFGFVLAKLYTSIARPITSLSTGIARYRNEEFSARVTVTNRSQIGYLQASYNMLAEKIEAMVADLRKLDELKTEFLSTVSHELRTPLTSIGGYVKLLASGDAGPINDSQREFLGIVDTNVNRLTHLINDLLDVEKMNSGKIQLNRKPEDLVSVLMECRDTFEVLARQKGLDLRFAVDVESAAVFGDRDRLVQVFMNLLSNAIKYTLKGYVEISVERRDYAACVRIRDTGVGLSGEEQGKIFDKFYRARSGLITHEGGTGLGLVIVRGLVEAHGGQITVESEPDKGTTFTVTLPLYEEPKEIEDLLFKPVGLASSHVRLIWLVEPSEAEGQRLSDWITAAAKQWQGTNVEVMWFRSVADIPEAPSWESAPAMAIVNPSEEGGEATALPLLRRKARQSLPILIVGGSDDATEAFAEGASAWVAQPIDQSKFIAAVRDLVSRKGWRVLLADSNTDLRILIRRALEQRGMAVEDVDHGAQVLGRLEQEHFDLALLEMHLPDLPALEVLKVMRRGQRFKELPVFLMSVEEWDAPSSEKLKEWGAQQFVPKYKGLANIVDSVCQFLEDQKLIEQHH